MVAIVGDATQAAATLAAFTGLVAAGVGVANLVVSLRRERPRVGVFVRHWSTGPQGAERYVDVVATNVGRRPLTVVSMGLRLSTGARTWRLEDGQTSPALPARLEDGATVVMRWLWEELGETHYSGEARIVGCFAVDGRGHEVQGGIA